MKPWMRTTLLALLIIPVVLIGIGGSLVLQESGRWPSLEETPPVTGPKAPAPGDGDGWALVQKAMNASIGKESFRPMLENAGPPPVTQLGAWRREVSAIAAAQRILTDSQGLTLPEPEVGQPGPDLKPLMRLADAGLLRAWSSAVQGETARAAAEMAQIVQLGARLTRGDTGLTGARAGLTIERRARTELIELLQSLAAEDPAAFDAAAATLPSPPDAAIARGAARACTQREALYRVLEDNPRAAAGLGDIPPALSFGGAYDLDTTLVWSRLTCEALIAHLTAPAWDRVPLASLGLWRDGPHLVQYLHNPAGRILLSAEKTAHTALVRREDIERARAVVLEAWIAARRYALSHEGKNPDRLEALVPTLLDAVPTDPLKGGQIQYDTSAVWSAGSDDEAALRLPL